MSSRASAHERVQAHTSAWLQVEYMNTATNPLLAEAINTTVQVSERSSLAAPPWRGLVGRVCVCWPQSKDCGRGNEPGTGEGTAHCGADELSRRL